MYIEFPVEPKLSSINLFVQARFDYAEDLN